eukprot:1815247-Pyramimonas_sp.AAC.1
MMIDALQDFRSPAVTGLDSGSQRGLGEQSDALSDGLRGNFKARGICMFQTTQWNDSMGRNA